MSSSFYSWCSWTKWEHWVNLRFYPFVSIVNQGNEERRWVQDFLVLPQGFGSFPSVFSRARWRNLVRVECLNIINPMMVDANFGDGFYYCFFYSQKELGITKSYLQFCLKKAINGCGVWEHFHSFTEMKYFQGCSKTLWMGIQFLKLPPLLVQHLVPIRGTPTQEDPNQWL